ncbi:hypothetical protein SAMN05216369_1555 [Marinobacter antarcticus]|uniref:Uncharacterized protein n=1 Tax=Marinobacter antarcticus TaxID=564117 RepID=A0A1M6RKA4_9GAMM|nr:hypothetical protein [Marinobacter antarcticus]SHK32767.1 hypothetical protein SAMN05216369_1555 [Marinobacter antarcticus]
MKDKPNENKDDPCLPGGLIPAEQWVLPQTSVRRSLKDALGHALKQLRAGVSQVEEPFESMDDLPELSATEQRRLAPEPDFSDQAMAIDRCLEDARSEGALRREVVCLIAPPFSGVQQALSSFSEGIRPARDGGNEEGWTIILPPDTLLFDDQEAGEWWDKQDLSRPWIIPELADFWLRRLSGLALVKELFRRIANGDAGAGIVGCSSWCWQYWGHYLENAQMSPWTPAPMDSERLGLWLTQLASGSGKSSVSARTAGDGLYVLPIAETDETEKNKSSKKRKYSTFLRDLAALSRGNPGVALAIWQRSIRGRPDDDAKVEEADETSDRQSRTADCWVVPLDRLSLPTMPQSKKSFTGFVLHGLLQHNGLDAASLESVTGVSAHELSLLLSRLNRAELVVYEPSRGHWQVTAIGYPTVRRHLQSWGFPVDQF